MPSDDNRTPTASHPLVPHAGTHALGPLGDVDREVAGYATKAFADGTRNAYEAHWRGFVEWCLHHNLHPLPAEPETVARYAAFRARDCSAATVDLTVQAIRHAHETRDLPTPTSHPGVKRVLSGIRRTLGTRQKQADPIRHVALRAAMDRIEPTLKGARDRALLMVGWAAALRRSEIVAIDVDHLTFRPEGAVLLIPRSKTDQLGEGALVALHRARDPRYCPVATVQEWLISAGIEGGSVFRGIDRHGNLKRRLTDQSVNLVVKDRVAPYCDRPDRISAHSLRAGFITEAAERGIPEHRIQMHSRHRSREALAMYIRTAQLFQTDLGRVVDPE
jgi:integrase